MPNFSHYKAGQVIGYNGAAYVISHAERRYIKAVNLSTNELTITVKNEDGTEAPPILADNTLDYVSAVIERNF